jgi:hypothetical protein
MQLSDDAQRRVLEVLNPPTDTMTTGTKVVTSE